MDEKEQVKRPRSASSRELTKWFAGRRNNVERWVEETCRGAIAKARGVVAEEIRGLSRRVDRVHELLDQVEQMVDAQETDAAGDAAELVADGADAGGMDNGQS